jgi:hypothetical protein
MKGSGRMAESEDLNGPRMIPISIHLIKFLPGCSLFLGTQIIDTIIPDLVRRWCHTMGYDRQTDGHGVGGQNTSSEPEKICLRWTG